MSDDSPSPDFQDIGPDTNTGGAVHPTSTAEADSGWQTRAKRALSPRHHLLTLLAVISGFVVMNIVGGALPLGPITDAVGIGFATFCLGLLSDVRRYFPAAVSGAIVAGVAAFFDMIVLTVAGIGGTVVLLIAGVGALIAVLGHYFGRDLRVGVTKDL